jgi:uncharacterized protein YjbJ (UPF0337 family)
MSDEQHEKEQEKHGLKERISGVGQVIIGEIETIGGVLTGDPATQAEGEFNVEVGSVREEIEEDLDTDTLADTDQK